MLNGYNRVMDLVSRIVTLGFFANDSPWGKAIQYNENQTLRQKGLYKGTFRRADDFVDFIQNEEP